MRTLSKIFGWLMLLLWVLYQAHIYNLMWGFWGFIASFIFFLPLTLYTFFLSLMSGEWLNLLVSILYVLVLLVLLVYGDEKNK